MSESTSTSFIVVGVDGSPSSRHALLWAAGQARLTGADLHAVCAWDYPTTFGWASDYSDVDLAGDTRKELDATIAEVLGGLPDVPVVPRVERGHAASVLVDASRDADLLVVGSRGHGAFTGMLLGSVSQHCAQHAECPVLILRRHKEAEAEEVRTHQAQAQARAQAQTGGLQCPA
jgi:nucleotide-binding universal stress UspA family protein